MKFFRKLFILTVALIIAAGSVCAVGCTPQAYISEEERTEILSAVNELYEKSLELNEYIFGKGMSVSDYDSDGTSSPLYVDVAEDAPYRTEADFERAILSVYSTDYYEASIALMLFEGYENQTVKKPRYRERNGVLQFDVTSEAEFSDLSGRFDLSTAKVVSVSSETAVVRCFYERGDYSGECTLTLERVSSGWRFAAPTF